MKPFPCALMGFALVVFGFLPVRLGAQDASPRLGTEPVPCISDVVFDPIMPATGSTLRLRFKVLDPTSRVEVRWFVDGQEAGVIDYDGVSNFVELARSLKAGEVVKADVTCFDHSGVKGRTIEKTIVCAIAPPSLKLAGQRIETDTYFAKILASDPQGRPVTLSLTGPPGMQIDPDGNIRWNIAPGTTGTFSVKVVAKNDRGAETVLTYSLAIRRQ